MAIPSRPQARGPVGTASAGAREVPVSEPGPRIIPIDDLDDLGDDPGEIDAAESTPATIVVRPPFGSRQVRAFARLAAVVDRVPSTEVPTEAPASDPGISVHTRPSHPDGSTARLRQEAIDALAEKQGEHEAAVDHARVCWEAVHELEDRVARARDEEEGALRAYELLRDGRRSIERKLRLARADAEIANQRRLVSSRSLDAARIRAERL